MAVAEKSQLFEYLEQQSQEAWIDALDELASSIHPVDRDATRIWFAFWPLELKDALDAPEGVEEMARAMDLEGQYLLADQMDASVLFLFGAHYWMAAKKAALGADAGASLAEAIRSVAQSVVETWGSPLKRG